MAFKVTEVIDGDTFKVLPVWKWNDKEGDTARANGYETPPNRASLVIRK